MSIRTGEREFAAILAEIGEGLPSAAQYQGLSRLNLDVPEARRLSRLDSFSPECRRAAVALYLLLRGGLNRHDDAERDEEPAHRPPTDLWTGLVPWSFRDPALVGEHLLA